VLNTFVLWNQSS